MLNKQPAKSHQFFRIIGGTGTVLCILLIHHSVRAQKEKETGYESSVQLLAASGLSLGTQTVSIPPFSTKASLGGAYSFNRSSCYLLPGVTIGLVYSGFHVESGFRYRFATIDHSMDWLQRSYGGNKYHSKSINLGCVIQLNAKRNDDLWLWLKAGKSYQLRGYSDEDPPELNGYNFEIKVVYMLNESLLN